MGQKIDPTKGIKGELKTLHDKKWHWADAKIVGDKKF